MCKNVRNSKNQFKKPPNDSFAGPPEQTSPWAGLVFDVKAVWS